VQVTYRRITLESRADHVEALVVLARLVTPLPAAQFVRRSFYVMTLQGF
jgi:hypothetical protein